MTAQAQLVTIAKARGMTMAQKTETLIDAFEMTETINDRESATVRGWIMDELETRNQTAFDAWLDANEASPRGFFLN